MADDYLEFSQVVANLSQQEADWLRQELAMIDVYGRQVQMSEPKTSEPLHSSCTRTARGLSRSGMLATSPNM